jgi:predicted transcriptional regulator of viral defense system
MKFEELLELVPPEGIFRTGQILAGRQRPEDVRRQLHRWIRQGRVIQLRREVYMLRDGRAGTRPHPFVIANYLKVGSYVSLQSALSHYGMIPEYVPVTTSVTTGRPETLDTEVGRFQFRHVASRLFTRFEMVPVAPHQEAFVATPEKALLDLLYLTPYSDDVNYLRELRLAVPSTMDSEVFIRRLHEGAEETKVEKLKRAAQRIEGIDL